jgi:autotransporter-associated beta strand protein
MERFSYMTNAQALEVMKTTGVQNGTINDAASVAIANPNAGKMTQAPDSRNGWGTVSLRNAMNGPGQFMGRFAVNTQGQNDTWSNNISDVAIKARKLEDQAEAASWASTKTTKGWTNGLPGGASADDQTEYTMGMAREAARNARVYEGSLAKSGAGTLVLSGDNSFSGGTEVFGGSLVGRSANAFGSGDVTVHGGILAGMATIQGDLLNEAGHIAPGEGSIGTLKVLGNFAQLAMGALDLEIGLAGTDFLNVGGTAFLGGTLQLSFLDSLQSGSYTLLSASNFMGHFASVEIDGLSAGYTGKLFYGADSIRLDVSAVPEPHTYALLLGGLGRFAAGGAPPPQAGLSHRQRIALPGVPCTEAPRGALFSCPRCGTIAIEPPARPPSLPEPPYAMSLVFPHTFVPWFRSVAPYIHAYRGETFVVGMPGELVAAGQAERLCAGTSRSCMRWASRSCWSTAFGPRSTSSWPPRATPRTTATACASPMP